MYVALGAFLGRMLTPAFRSPEGSRYFQLRISGAVNATSTYDLQRTIPSVRAAVTASSPRRIHASIGILTDCPSTTPFGFALGPD